MRLDFFYEGDGSRYEFLVKAFLLLGVVIRAAK